MESSDSKPSALKIQDVPSLLFEVLHRLAQRLPAELTYHSIDHTAEVIAYSNLFAKADGINERDLSLLNIAAAFHDIGYLVERSNHEELGAELASALLASLGTFTEAECCLVRDTILDTQVCQHGRWQVHTLRTHLAPYLCDADVSNFGRQSFLDKLELVRKEVGAKPDKDFYQSVLNMLEAHSWHSNYAKQHLEAQKQRNRAELKELLSRLSSYSG